LLTYLQTEIEGFRQSHLRDGAALVRYFAWLEEALHKGEKLSEYDAAKVLEKYRRYALLKHPEMKS
jgi:Xaa-Pro aminopeptidase